MGALSWRNYAQSLGLSSLRACDVTIYPASHQLFIAEKNVPCTLTHLHFLEMLLSNLCKTVTRQQLMGAGDRPLLSYELNRLRVQMCSLKRLLRVHGAQIEVRTVYDFGYQARPIWEL